MTDHVARAMEREFANHLDPCDLYELKAKVEQFLRPTRDAITQKRTDLAMAGDYFTDSEVKKLAAINLGRKRRFEY